MSLLSLRAAREDLPRRHARGERDRSPHRKGRVHRAPWPVRPRQHHHAADDCRARVFRRGGAPCRRRSTSTQLRPSRRDVGTVFEFYALYPHLTASTTLGSRCVPPASPPPTSELRSTPSRAPDGARTRLLLALPRSELSGGDQQRIPLGRRAIVRLPLVYLMDEPLGTLTPVSGARDALVHSR